jgi:outer membrane protein
MLSCPAMKNLRLTLLTVVLLAATAFSAAAQTKIATVDMKKIFNAYWKTKQATTALENRKADLRKELKEQADGLEKAQTDYKQLLDQSNDQAISADEREKRKESAAVKAREINKSKMDLDQYQRQAEAQLAEIEKAVSDKAQAGGYTLVLNSAASELITVVYFDPKTDITEAVITQLNAGAPIDLSKPAGGVPLNNISTNLP